jgi:hypothetical protein
MEGKPCDLLTADHLYAVATTIVNQSLTHDTKELLVLDVGEQDVGTTLDACVPAMSVHVVCGTPNFERAWLLYVIARVNINRELLGTLEVQDEPGVAANDFDLNSDWDFDLPDIAERTRQILGEYVRSIQTLNDVVEGHFPGEKVEEVMARGEYPAVRRLIIAAALAPDADPESDE